jgi:hypothetical protein
MPFNIYEELPHSAKAIRLFSTVMGSIVIYNGRIILNKGMEKFCGAADPHLRVRQASASYFMCFIFFNG